MECVKIENLSFGYPEREGDALKNINITVNKGELVTVIGKSGCGKTTLLRMLKPSISPYGKRRGSILFMGRELSELSAREESESIGFVMQNPENQTVTDKVWHELAFGLESLGVPTDEIRARVAETASFFGIRDMFHESTSALSGGQKQLLNLASVMVMQPSVLILDEPTSQLDPIAAEEFIKTLEKINRETGTTIILSEHRTEAVFAISDRVIVMEDGMITASDRPEKMGSLLKNNDMSLALPTPMKIHSALISDKEEASPLTVRDGRAWLSEYVEKKGADTSKIVHEVKNDTGCPAAVEARDVYFRYEKDGDDVVRGMSLTVYEGEHFVIVGGNGAGKSTALSLISGIKKPYSGEIKIEGERPEKIKGLYERVLAVLPQNPETLFIKKTVREDLKEALCNMNLSDDEKEQRVEEAVRLFGLYGLEESHPYDLSGGEKQRAAIAKVMMKRPRILVMDEPTKGMDAHLKARLAEILHSVTESGVTVITVTHDIEFAAEHADRCAMFFDGKTVSCAPPKSFFSDKSFYTTAACRMARGIVPGAVLADEVISALGGTAEKKRSQEKCGNIMGLPKPTERKNNEEKREKISSGRRALGIISFLLFLLSGLFYKFGFDFFGINKSRAGAGAALFTAIFFLTAAAVLFFPQREIGRASAPIKITEGKTGKRTAAAALMIVLLIPLTLYVGIRYWGDERYYLTSLLIIAETMLPFFMVFEGRRPQAREIVIISVLSAIAVAGRAAFFMLPQFKPTAAIVITAGLCFGGETGFLVGAVAALVSNFLFGQGPWTPWQMFALGLIGFASGLLFYGGRIKKTRITLSVFGFLATLVIYGGIMNPAALIMSRRDITWPMIASYYAAGLPLDLIHAFSTAFFLWFLAEPMTEKLERVKIKYGLIRR